MDQLAPCSIESLKGAANQLQKGALVALPTETVYGLGVDAENESAVARMYQVKGRPANHPVIVHISNQSQVGYRD